MPDDRTIVLAAPLRNRYTAGSFEISANVALATHGTTVDAEVLGSADVTVAHQRFTLAQAPLTQLPAPTDSGTRDTLVVSVDGVPWQEVTALRDSGPDDEVYQARRDGDGRTEVVFGDGVHGARPPTGVDNVTAGYRHGLGSAGNVLPHSLVLMQTRPLGVQEVTNPLSATGGADAETGVESGSRLRQRVLAVDRLVTPADFEQFATAFAGIAATQATALSANGAALLHLTVAGLGGQPVPAGSSLYDGLVEAIDQRRPHGPEVRIESYRPLRVAMAARLLVDRRHDPAAVAAEAERSVRATFAVGGRDLGQPVRRGEMITLLQNVTGVLAVDLDRLSLEGDAAVPQRIVPCHRARWTGDAVLPAELLVAGAVELSAGWVPRAAGRGGR
jgi:predicted phage baseplate assembly protein